MERSGSRAGVLPVAVVAIVGGVLFAWLTSLRVHRNPLWRDELATREFSALSWPDLVRAVRHVDVVYVFYYGAMHLGRLVTDSQWALRGPSLVAGTVIVLAVAVLSGRVWGVAAAIAAGGVVATNAALILLGAFARPYVLSTMFMLLALGALIRIQPESGRSAGSVFWPQPAVRDGRRWVLVAVLATAACALQPLSVLLMAAFLPWVDRRALKAAIASAVVPVVTAVMLLAAGSRQSAQVVWITQITWRDVATMTVRATGIPRAGWILGGAFVVAVLLQIVLRRIDRLWLSGLLLLVAPSVLLQVASLTVHPMMVDRYLMGAIPGATLLVAGAVGLVAQVGRRRSAGIDALMRVVATVLVVVLVGTSMLLGKEATTSLVEQHVGGEAYPEVARWLTDHAEVGDTVLSIESYGSGGYTYGVAAALGDSQFETDIERALVTGTQIRMFRRVVSRSPFRTVGESEAAPGTRIWMLGGVQEFLAQRSEDCRQVGPEKGFGVSRVALATCRTALSVGS